MEELQDIQKALRAETCSIILREKDYFVLRIRKTDRVINIYEKNRFKEYRIEYEIFYWGKMSWGNVYNVYQKSRQKVIKETREILNEKRIYQHGRTIKRG